MTASTDASEAVHEPAAETAQDTETGSDSAQAVSPPPPSEPGDIAPPEGTESAPARQEPPGPDAAESTAAEGVDPAAISGMLEQIFHDMEFECSVTIEVEEDGFLASIDGAGGERALSVRSGATDQQRFSPQAPARPQSTGGCR